MKFRRYSFLDCVKIVVGAVLAAAGFQFFTLPNDIVSGGVTGLAQIIFLLTRVPVGVLIIAMNIPLFVVCWKRLGLNSLIGALVVMLLNSVLIDLFALTKLVATDEPLLAAVYGGVLNGLGYGLVYTVGMTGGGVDIVAKLLRRHYPHINFGTFLLLMNVIVVLTFAVLFRKYDSCMYTMINMFISTRVINLVLYGPGVSNVCYIISDKSEKIKDAITCEMGRGVTFLKAEGAWSHQDRPVILCVIKRPEIARLRSLVRSADPDAFVIVTEAKDVFGKGFESILSED